MVRFKNHLTRWVTLKCWKKTLRTQKHNSSLKVLSETLTTTQTWIPKSKDVHRLVEMLNNLIFRFHQIKKDNNSCSKMKIWGKWRNKINLDQFTLVLTRIDLIQVLTSRTWICKHSKAKVKHLKDSLWIIILLILDLMERVINFIWWAPLDKDLVIIWRIWLKLLIWETIYLLISEMVLLKEILIIKGCKRSLSSITWLSTTGTLLAQVRMLEILQLLLLNKNLLVLHYSISDKTRKI